MCNASRLSLVRSVPLIIPSFEHSFGVDYKGVHLCLFHTVLH